MRATNLRSTSLVLCCAAAFALAAEAQSVTRITPPVASPGSTVLVDGQGLGAATHVRFTGFVGGFVGTLTVDAPVVSASDTRVVAVVPAINAFIPPGQAQGGSPFGELRVAKLAGLGLFWETLPSDFYLFEGTGGFLANDGLGTTQSNAVRSVAAFDPGPPVFSDTLFKALGTGAPVPGNASYVQRLEAAVPGSVPILFVAPPGPGIPLGDGSIAIDLVTQYLILAGPQVDANGDASLPLPVPATLLGAGPVVLQWAHYDVVGASLGISNALVVTF